MRSRVLWATLLLVVLGAVLAAATCASERVDDLARREGSAATDAVPSAGTTRDRSGVPAATRRLPRVRAAPPAEREPDPAVIEESEFHEPVAEWETEQRLDLVGAPAGVLVAKWIAMADSGVELERRAEGKILWRVHVEPLGIAHSKYHQAVTVRVDGDRVVVESAGARKILEVRDLATGSQTSREVTDVVR